MDTAVLLDPDNPRSHNNRGSALQLLGRVPEAEKAFQRALDLDPSLQQPYINLGHLLEERGNLREAADLYRRAIARGLDSELFGHYVAAASAQVTDRAPDRWVSATFDNFAPTFDAHLEALGYDAPRVLAKIVLDHGSGPMDVLDLGCGTGQCGRSLAKIKRSLIGVDLSEKMLAQARALGIYDELHLAEVHAWLRQSAAACFDLVIATDVFIYVGALGDLFDQAARVLRPNGWFAFTTEECESEEYTLQRTGRYAQSAAYIHRLSGSVFEIVVAEAATIRMEMGKPIAGRLYLLRKK